MRGTATTTSACAAARSWPSASSAGISEEVLAWFRAHFPEIGDRPADLRLCVGNGILDPLSEKLEPHSPDAIFINQIPVQWVPGAACLVFEKFVSEVLPADAIELVFEIMGLAMYSANPLRVAVLLLGPGGNGKTVLLRVIIALLGAANISNVPLQSSTENRFAAAEVFGKLADICGDLDARAIEQTDVFKMMTGGDSILAERKDRDHFSFTS